MTYTPSHATWLNMVEIFFSILTRRLLRRGEFASRDDLDHKIITFITHLQPDRQTLPMDLRRPTSSGPA